jgi:hypothetical protein
MHGAKLAHGRVGDLSTVPLALFMSLAEKPRGVLTKHM